MNVEVPQVLDNLFYRIFDDKIDLVVPQVHTGPLEQNLR